jgi:hypothetical protein
MLWGPNLPALAEDVETDVHCGACGALMVLTVGTETSRQLRCRCGEYFYAANKGMTAIRSAMPVELGRALDLVLNDLAPMTSNEPPASSTEATGGSSTEGV